MATVRPKPPSDSRLSAKRSHARHNHRPTYGLKRQQIIAAAGPVLQRYGLHSTTMAAIAREAGVDRATVYYYFPNKFEILREAIHVALDDMVSELDAVATSTGSASDRLRASICTVMNAFQRHYPHLYVFFEGGGADGVIDGDLDTSIIDAGRRYEGLVQGIVEEGDQFGEFRPALPLKVTVKVIVGMLNWTSRWFRPDRAMDATAIANAMADTVLDGMLT